MKNEIFARVIGKTGTVASGLYQYDYGQVLKLFGVPLPESYEVHFSTEEYGGQSVTVLGSRDGIAIPDSLLLTGETIYCFLFLHSGPDDGETVYKIKIPVIKRPRPTDVEPTPVEQSIITVAIAALNNGVERVETAMDDIDRTIDTALQNHMEEITDEVIESIDIIDDTATVGDTTRTWSADKISRELEGAGSVKDVRVDGVSVVDNEGIAEIPAHATADIIDDTAGDGDTDKTWSADKLTEELANAGSVTDVTVNGTSILDSQTGVAEIPVANSSTLGVVKSNPDGGVAVGTNGALRTDVASTNHIKLGSNQYKPIVPSSQHTATFYGLAKAAGDTTQAQSNNAVGTYTPAAALAIRNMIGATGESASITVTGTDPVIQASSNARYICGEVATLDFTPCSVGICEVIFTSGTTATVLTLPQTVQMPEWFVVEANHTYEISIIDGTYGAVGVW